MVSIQAWLVSALCYLLSPTLIVQCTNYVLLRMHNFVLFEIIFNPYFLSCNTIFILSAMYIINRSGKRQQLCLMHHFTILIAPNKLSFIPTIFHLDLILIPLPTNDSFKGNERRMYLYIKFYLYCREYYLTLGFSFKT